LINRADIANEQQKLANKISCRQNFGVVTYALRPTQEKVFTVGVVQDRDSLPPFDHKVARSCPK